MITTHAFRDALQRYTNLNLSGANDDLLYQISGHLKVFSIPKEDRGLVDGWRRQYERQNAAVKNNCCTG